MVIVPNKANVLEVTVEGFLFYFVVIIGAKTRASHNQGKYTTTTPHSLMSK